MDLPPVPLWLVKSPPWHMKLGMTRWKVDPKIQNFLGKISLKNLREINAYPCIRIPSLRCTKRGSFQQSWARHQFSTEKNFKNCKNYVKTAKSSVGIKLYLPNLQCSFISNRIINFNQLC